MSVVNCKVQYIKPKFNNLKEWMNDPQNVYVGRSGIVFIDGKRFPPNQSKFANPFKITEVETRDDVIAKYRVWITDKLDKDASLVKELLQLKGKNLGCWCHPEACHGDVLLELIEKYSTNS